MRPLAVDTAAVTTWLQRPCPNHRNDSRAACLGIDEQFHRGSDGFLDTIEDLVAAQPLGLRHRGDLAGVHLWLIPDGEVLACGALITVDLAGGIRLASLHQDVKDFTDRDQHGIPAAVAALAHISDQVSLIVERYDQASRDRGQPAAAWGEDPDAWGNR